MSRMAGDVDDEAEGSAAETAADLAAETAAHAGSGAGDGTEDPIDAYFDGIDERLYGLRDTVLKSRLDELEADRKRVRGYITRVVILVAIPALLYIFSDFLYMPLLPYRETSSAVRLLLDYWNVALLAVPVLALLIIASKIVIPGLAAHLEYRRKFKRTIATEVFKALMPDGTYQPDHYISQKAVDESGLFSGKYYKFRGDDLIRGRAGQIEFEASEIHAQGMFMRHRRKDSQHTSSKPNVTEFHGQIFHFGLHTTFKAHTIVEPELCEGRMPGHRRGFETVSFDADEAFGERFRVYSTDAAEAQRILNPRVRRRLVTLHENHLASVPFLSFVRNHAFVAVHSGRNSLEPTIAKPAGFGEISAFGQFFGTPALLVRELELDGSGAATAAFASPVFGSPAFPAAAGAAGGSILAQPAAATFGTLDLDKPITAGSITDAAFEEADDQDAARTPPANTRVTISPTTGEGFEATYAINPAFYVRILWTLALLPVVAAGFARLAGESGAPLLAAIVERVPQVTIVSDWAAEIPLAFVPLALLFYVLPTWTMMQIPRRVRISREGMTIRKRIWPIPRRLPMDKIAGVKVSDRQVLIQRTKTAFLRRWVSAAPVLGSTEEARWLGAHLRRALKMFGGLR